MHYVSDICEGELCLCGEPATHKLAEVVLGDDPNPMRHGLTSYVCCRCFRQVMGSESCRP